MDSEKDGAKGGMEAESGPLAGWPTGAGQETALDLFFCRDQRAVPCQLWESFLTGCEKGCCPLWSQERLERKPSEGEAVLWQSLWGKPLVDRRPEG